MAMIPRERIIATLKHEIPDRIPTDGWFHHEVIRALKEHYRTDDWEHVLDALGIEGWGYCGASLLFPEFERVKTLRPGSHPGKEAVWLDENTYRDCWGVEYRLGEGDWYEERVSGPLEDAEEVCDLEEYLWPGVDNVVVPADCRENILRQKESGFFVSMSVSNPYKIAWSLRGMDNVLCDYVAEPEILEYMYDKLYGFNLMLTLPLVRSGVDMVCVIGDVAMQDRMIMGPDSWRRFDKPRMAAFVDACREINPDIFMFIHSDGNITDIMGDLVEIGFDVINPIQPECMNPVEVKRLWGDKVTIHGGVSLQRTLPNGTVAEVEEEVDDLIRNCGYDGGLVVFPSNVIQPDTPVENIIACYHAARDFDLAG